MGWNGWCKLISISVLTDKTVSALYSSQPFIFVYIPMCRPAIWSGNPIVFLFYTWLFVKTAALFLDILEFHRKQFPPNGRGAGWMRGGREGFADISCVLTPSSSFPEEGIAHAHRFLILPTFGVLTNMPTTSVLSPQTSYCNHPPAPVTFGIAPVHRSLLSNRQNRLKPIPLTERSRYLHPRGCFASG